MAHGKALHSEVVDAKFAIGRAHLEDLIIISQFFTRVPLVFFKDTIEWSTWKIWDQISVLKFFIAKYVTAFLLIGFGDFSSQIKYTW